MAMTVRGFEYDEDPRQEEWHERMCCPYCGTQDYEDFYEQGGEIIGCTECIKFKAVL